MRSKINSVVSLDTQRGEMTSLNSHLLSEFSIEELETRMETDPLMLSQIFGITVNDCNDSIRPLCFCRGSLETCGEVSCTYTSPCSPVACHTNS